MKEYDIVKSVRDLDDKIPKGCRGTILIAFTDFPNAFVVEFVNESNETLDVLTVQAKEIVQVD
jgi:hypothetical protein